MQHLISSVDWIQLSAAGKSVTVRVDEQDDMRDLDEIIPTALAHVAED